VRLFSYACLGLRSSCEFDDTFVAAIFIEAAAGGTAWRATRKRDDLPNQLAFCSWVEGIASVRIGCVTHPDAKRESFDEVADQYASVRPEYPDAIYDDIASLSGAGPGAMVLEIGCGPGKASVALAKRGYRLQCIELGPKLAEIARARLAAFPSAQVTVGAFETLETETRFDLIVSAQAFHWIDRDVRVRKAATFLRPGGSLAIWWNKHVRVSADRGFFDAAQAIYREIVPGLELDLVRLRSPDQVPQPEREELIESGLFQTVETRTHLWERTYRAGDYARLLGTYSDHIAIPSETRSRLLQAIESLIEHSYGGAITKGYLTVLHVATKAA